MGNLVGRSLQAYSAISEGWMGRSVVLVARKCDGWCCTVLYTAAYTAANGPQMQDRHQPQQTCMRPFIPERASSFHYRLLHGGISSDRVLYRILANRYCTVQYSTAQYLYRPLGTSPSPRHFLILSPPSTISRENKYSCQMIHNYHISAQAVNKTALFVMPR